MEEEELEEDMQAERERLGNGGPEPPEDEGSEYEDLAEMIRQRARLIPQWASGGGDGDRIGDLALAQIRHRLLEILGKCLCHMFQMARQTSRRDMTCLATEPWQMSRHVAMFRRTGENFRSARCARRI